MSATPLRKKSLTDLSKDFDPIPRTDARSAQRLCQFRTQVGIIQLAPSRLDDNSTSAKIDQHVDHPMLVFQVIGAAKIDINVVWLELTAGRGEARFLRRNHERAACFAKANEFSELRLDHRARIRAE